MGDFLCKTFENSLSDVVLVRCISIVFHSSVDLRFECNLVGYPSLHSQAINTGQSGLGTSCISNNNGFSGKKSHNEISNEMPPLHAVTMSLIML